MKTLFAGWVGLGMVLGLAVAAQGATRAEQWKQVDAAVQKGLPQTATNLLAPLIREALADRAYGEAAKAIARRIVLEGNIQGNKPEEKIARLEAEIAHAPKELVPLLATLQADWFWHYFQQNRWRFLQRTQTATEPGKDFTTWDLPRLFSEIDRQFRTALIGAELLQKTPLAQFGDLLEPGSLPDAYRPTLYDFIAQEALKFYTSGEQAAAKPEDAFELTADRPIYGLVPLFGPVAEFLSGKIERRTDEAPAEAALFLYRDLLRFHQRDVDKTAFLDVDLDRLRWAQNAAFGESKNELYQKALKSFVDQWADHEVAARALHDWASVLQQEHHLVEARRLALQGAQAHPQSLGGRMCRNLVSEIEARSSSISTEHVWNHPLPKIQVRYRNLTQVWLRVVADDWSSFLAKERSRPEHLNDRDRKELLAKAPVRAWSADLPPTADFKERVQELPAPDDLKPGFYFIVASHDPTFAEADNIVTFADVWVSDLALIVRTRDASLDALVLEAGSGEPIQGAEVIAWHLDNNGNRIAHAPLSTDENGWCDLQRAPDGRGLLVRARHQGREIASRQEYWAWDSNWRQQEQPRRQTIFFTDRSIYRPGQTVQYKGLCLKVDPSKDNYEVLSDCELTVVFADLNGKEVARARHRSNPYGSFSGSFTTPRDRLNGTMQLRVEGEPTGVAQFNVEEYKRPKFQVTLEAPKTAPKLNDPVSVLGKAESYTGAAVDDASVKFRVVREVRWPSWRGGWGWRGGWQGNSSQEIAHGTVRSGADGVFKIEFAAKPDASISPTNEPSFSFSVHADVTDSTGETRSADRSVRVGYAALETSLETDGWQTDDKTVELRLKTTTLDGEPQVAEGSVKVYRLQEPAQVVRPSLGGGFGPFGGAPADMEPRPDLSHPDQWVLGEVVLEKGFTTDAEGKSALQLKLGLGAYRVTLESQDRFGKKVTARLPLQVLRPADPKLSLKIPHLLEAPRWVVEPGQEFMALWGTGYDTGRAFVEIEHRHQMLQRFWTKPGQTQQQLRLAVNETARGGFTLHVTQVRENRAYLDSRSVSVPWSNKELQIQWEHFVSKLQPSQKETWSAVIRARSTNAAASETVAAEMVATLYDQSLDQYLRHDWPHGLDIFRHDASNLSSHFENQVLGLQWLRGAWKQSSLDVSYRYRQFPSDLVANWWGYGFPRRAMMSRVAGAQVQMLGAAPLAMNAPAPMADAMIAPAVMAPTLSVNAAPASKSAPVASFGAAATQSAQAQGGGAAGSVPRPDLSQVAARRNLNETAFFFPQLVSDSNGVVRMTFTMPEALTRWRFLGFAHDQGLRSGLLEDNAVTAKDLMVQPNPPRFLREGDTLEFTVKVSNQSAARQQGRVRLTFAEAVSEKSADALLHNSSPELEFDLPSKDSRTFSWRITVPDGCGFLSYKAVASTGRVSDGEEGCLPVLSRRVFVTESLPLPIRGPATKKFEFTQLLESGKSDTLRSESLVVQMVSNPAWYAVLALPYLMEFPHECAEQKFNRFYANALGRLIANSDPKIRKIFDLWKNTPALDSPLEKNQDLKAVALEETPWLRQAQDESQARRNLGVLFDDNRLNAEAERLLRELQEMQLGDGSWPWFPGGRGNDYITLYIATGFGRLRHLGVDVLPPGLLRVLNHLDAWMDEEYRRLLQRTNPDEYVLSSTDCLYLYGRSFFLKDRPPARQYEAALNFFLKQGRKYWLQVGTRQSQGHLALACQRWGGDENLAVARDIMRSIKERGVSNEEMGLFWRETELSWWWYRAPIETQALMIEAFDEVMGDAQAVEDCRVWLLTQKQTQDWKTTKATADAVYALLLRGKDLLASDKLVEVRLDGVNVTPQAAAPIPALPSDGRGGKGEGAPAVEPGTGFYEARFGPGQIKPRLGHITVQKSDPGVAWGSVHWQYLEDMTKITPYAGTPLQLKKTLFTKVNTVKGPTLQPVQGPLRVGDELVVRIELRVDRDMEYVHLKDQRGSGTEPVNVLSRYRYQDGLAYYETTRETASHFFMDYLPKGVYVFEYSTRVQHRGSYQTGLASIQCLYAPEFNSHSESLPLEVR